MKKVILSIGLMTICAVTTFAQKGEKAAGVNLGYGTEIKNVGIGAKFQYNVTDVIRLEPSFNYFLKKDGVSAWEINADVHYLFDVAPKIKVYPLAGLTFTSWEFDFGRIFEEWEGFEIEDDNSSFTETKLGVNIGAGIAYQLTEKITAGLELKYSIISDFDQFVPMINVMYNF